MAGNSKWTSYSNTCSSRLISTILTPLILILEVLSTYNFQGRIIKGYSTRASNLVEEMLIEGRDSNAFIGHSNEHSTIRPVKT
jgi:hypothetical protein